MLKWNNLCSSLCFQPGCAACGRSVRWCCVVLCSSPSTGGRQHRAQHLLHINTSFSPLLCVQFTPLRGGVSFCLYLWGLCSFPFLVLFKLEVLLFCSHLFSSQHVGFDSWCRWKLCWVEFQFSSSTAAFKGGTATSNVCAFRPIAWCTPRDWTVGPAAGRQV